MRITTLSVIAAAAVLGVAACTNPDGTRNNQATGALVGAGAGGVLGQAIGGNSRGTLVGAGVGATTGALVGRSQDRAQAGL